MADLDFELTQPTRLFSYSIQTKCKWDKKIVTKRSSFGLQQHSNGNKKKEWTTRQIIILGEKWKKIHRLNDVVEPIGNSITYYVYEKANFKWDICMPFRLLCVMYSILF